MDVLLVFLAVWAIFIMISDIHYEIHKRKCSKNLENFKLKTGLEDTNLYNH